MSGSYEIAISLHGIPLPASPYPITVLMPRPDPTKCILKGDALNKAIAREQAGFGPRRGARCARE